MSDIKLFPHTQVLAFHKISARFTYGVTNYTPVRFTKLLIKLQSSNYRFISLDDLSSDNIEKSNRLLISFDDGYKHLYNVLRPMIDTFGIKPHIFIPTSFIGKNNSWDYSYIMQNDPHLSVSEIRELSRHGVTFGSHGHSHNNLTAMNPVQVKSELKKSKEILEDIIGGEVISISYPFGRSNKLVTEISADIGYQYGFTMKFPGFDDRPLSMGRIPVYAYDFHFNLFQKLNRGMFYNLEKMKAGVTNFLSGGTVVFNKVLKRNAD